MHSWKFEVFVNLSVQTLYIIPGNELQVENLFVR